MTAAELQEAELRATGAYDGFEDNFAQTKLSVVDAVDLIAKPFTPPRFRVRSLVPWVGTVLLSGDTGALKTALMMHTAVCIATGKSVADRFEVERDPRPQLYLNGEMGAELLRTYLHQAAAGLGVEIERGRILFEGCPDGVAGFRYNEPDSRDQLEALFDRYSPSVVYFDTQRALFGIDENDTGAVRNACRWLQSLCNKHQSAIELSHHLRKIGPNSNSAHERVAGSRDWIAAVDVHLEAKSREGGPMHTLAIGKTRMPTTEAMAGTEWPIKARLEHGSDPPRSIIVAEEPTRGESVQQVADVVGELRARLEAEGPLTIEAMHAESGNAKRAYEKLRKSGELVQTGNDGRKLLFGLVGRHDEPVLLEANAVSADRARDRTREKPSNGKGLNAVKAQPHSDRAGTSGPDAVSAPPGADRSSVPPTVVKNDERGQRSALYIDRVRDRTRSRPDFEDDSEVL